MRCRNMAALLRERTARTKIQFLLKEIHDYAMT